MCKERQPLGQQKTSPTLWILQKATSSVNMYLSWKQITAIGQYSLTPREPELANLGIYQ